MRNLERCIYRLTWREDVAEFNWDLTATIVDANPEPFAKFGASLAMAIDAKTLVVGAFRSILVRREWVYP